MATEKFPEAYLDAFPGTSPVTSPTWVRAIYGLFVLWFALLGVHMLIDPAGWYSSTPGVPAEGPMNSHFIRDIGAAFIMVAVCYGFSLQQRASWQLPTIAAVLPAIHGGIHLIGLLSGHSHGTAFFVELLGVIFPGGLAVVLPLVHYKHQKKGTRDEVAL